MRIQICAVEKAIFLEYRHRVAPSLSRFRNQSRMIVRRQETCASEPATSEFLAVPSTYPSQDHNPIICSPSPKDPKATDESGDDEQSREDEGGGRYDERGLAPPMERVD